MSLISELSKNMSPAERRAVTQIVSDAKREFGKIFDQEMAKAPDDPVLFRVGDEKTGATVRLSDLSPQRLRELGKLQDSTVKFESILFSKMLESMERTVPKSPYDGPMGQMGREMFRETFSEELAKNTGMGIASTMFRQLARTFLGQEATSILRERAAQTNQETKNDQNP